MELEPINLTTNFRSQAGVVDFVNEAFPRVMPSKEDESSGAVPYAPSTAHYDRLPGEAATVHLFEDSQDEAKNELTKFTQFAPKAYIAKTEIYMGCIH